VLARGFAGGDSGGGGAYYHDVPLEITGRRAVRRPPGLRARRWGKPPRQAGISAAEAHVTANHAVRGRVGTNAAADRPSCT